MAVAVISKTGQRLMPTLADLQIIKRQGGYVAPPTA